jgi:MFS family permease
MHASYGLGATIGPLLVTALLSNGLGWRWAYGTMAAALIVLTWVFTLARKSWEGPPRAQVPRLGRLSKDGPPPTGREHQKPPFSAVAGGLTFAAVETGSSPAPASGATSS